MSKQCKHFVFVLLLLNCFAARAQQLSSSDPDNFIRALDKIRTELKIPGMAAALAQNDVVLFTKGFGYADVKNQVKVNAHTTFKVASITKTLTSSIIMQLVENGKLNLDDPVSKYGLDYGNKAITVRHLLTHTSEGIPGTHYQYNGSRFAGLTIVIEQASGRLFYALVMEEIIKPTGMNASAPGISLGKYFGYVKERKDMQPFFENAFVNLAKPYDVDGNGKVFESGYYNEFGAFGGLASNVTDLLKYSAAIDKNKFVTPTTQALIFTPHRTNDGAITPYGLGWFTQQVNGRDIYWHYGQSQGESALFVKIPSLKITFAITANTDKLSQPFQLGDGDVLSSPVGQLLYKYFVDKHKTLKEVDYSEPLAALKTFFSAVNDSVTKAFYNKEIITQATISNFSGDTAQAGKLYELYAGLNFQRTKDVVATNVIASLEKVGINQNLSQTFTLKELTHVTIYGVGENCSGDFSSWCDYGWIEDSKGSTIWQMQGQPAKHAGGAVKNQRVEMKIDLPAGTYTLHYKSDGGHAYNNWDSAPPDAFFWGIIVSI